jgi:hypothetical protein
MGERMFMQGESLTPPLLTHVRWKYVTMLSTQWTARDTRVGATHRPTAVTLQRTYDFECS